jgi:hypothetical protein
VVLGGFGGVLGELGNLPLWAVDLRHCAGGFGWFWGDRKFVFVGS